MNIQSILLLITRLAPPLALAACVYLLYSSAKNPLLWKTNSTDSPEEQQARENKRAFLSSIINGLATSVIAVAMTAMGADPAMVAILFSLLFANITGFVLDSLLISDQGVDSLRQNTWLGHTLRRLGSWDFARYCMSLVLDVAIMEPLIGAVTGSSTIGLLKSALAAGSGYDRFVGSNLDGLLTTVLSLVGFYAFSQSTKSLWGYVSDKVPQQQRLQGSVVALAIAVASVTTLKSGPGLALAGLSGMAALSVTGHLDKTASEGSGNLLVGAGLGAASVAMGLVAPFTL